MRWARIEADAVVEVTPDDPSGRFHQDIVWVSCGSDVAQGWTYVNGEFAAPVVPKPTLAQRLAALAAERYAHQTAGVSFKAASAAVSARAASDPTSTGLLTASYVAARDGHWTDGTPWKMLDGSFVPLSAAEMQQLALTVLGYVAACFAHESTLAAALATNLDTDITAGWPANA